MSKPPVLVALLASPRRQGNSAALLQAFLKPLRAWDVKVFHLPSLNVHPCQACDHCLREKTYHCRFADDMPKLIRAWETASALVLSTPVYYYSLPAQTKAVVDRCHPLFHDSHWQKHARRPGYLLANGAGGRFPGSVNCGPQSSARFSRTAARACGCVRKIPDCCLPS